MYHPAPIQPTCLVLIYFHCIFRYTPVFWPGTLCSDFKDISRQKGVRDCWTFLYKFKLEEWDSWPEKVTWTPLVISSWALRHLIGAEGSDGEVHLIMAGLPCGIVCCSGSMVTIGEFLRNTTWSNIQTTGLKFSKSSLRAYFGMSPPMPTTFTGTSDCASTSFVSEYAVQMYIPEAEASTLYTTRIPSRSSEYLGRGLRSSLDHRNLYQKYFVSPYRIHKTEN